MKVFEIYNFVDSIAPFKNQMDFDNAGFLVGNKNENVTGIVVSLDCTSATVEFAKEKDANLIITHHPVIFDSLKSVTENSIVYNLIKNNISVISAHTNLDFSNGGINDTLCEILKLKNITKHNEYFPEVYELRIGETEPTTPTEYAKILKQTFNIPIKYVCGNRNIKRVAVCSGSGGSLLENAEILGADALVTADIKHNQFLLAEHLGISLFECGHFNTEDIITEPLKQKLQSVTNLNIYTFHGNEIKYC